MSLFEGYERRIDKINKVCKEYGIASIEDAKKICDGKGVKAGEIVKDLQPIAFDNAAWAYTLGAAIAIKKGCTKAVDAAKAIGEGLQAFCVPGPSQITARSASGTATLAPCSSRRKQAASHSSQAMNPLPRQRAQSASRRRQTRFERTRFVLS